MRILYNKKHNKEIYILTPTTEAILKIGLENILKKDIPEDATSILIADDSILPKDKYFMKAWELCDRMGVIVDIKRAKEVHCNNLRGIRDEKLEELDKKQIRYISNSGEVELIEKEKEVLRDLPKKFVDEIQDMDNLNEIKNYIPKELK